MADWAARQLWASAGYNPQCKKGALSDAETRECALSILSFFADPTKALTTRARRQRKSCNRWDVANHQKVSRTIATCGLIL